ncbi:MAG TPA: hypothetical protein DCO79_10010 [Spirochaeta sp.]|nr:hypothetical protein [Spirochaeta sp.]
MKAILIKTIISVSAVLLIISCERASTSVQLEDSGVRSVNTLKLNMKEVRQQIDGFGNLSFRKKTDVTSAVDGIISELFLEEGESVAEDQSLASLHNIQLEIRLQQAEAALFSAESAHELAETSYHEGRLQVESRLLSIEKSELNLIQKELELEHQKGLLENQKELFSIGGSTEEELAAMELSFSALETEVKILRKDIEIQKIGFRDSDIRSFGYRVPDSEDRRRELLLDINSLTLKSEVKVAQAKVRSADTELDSAKALLSEAEITSPITGIVGARYMEEGERASADDKLYTIFESTEVDLVFSVPEEIGVLLEPGQVVKLSMDAVAEREYSAVVSRISPTIDTRSGNITVRAELDNNEGLFRPGMFSRFSLTYGSPKQVLTIPDAALTERDGNNAGVILVRSGRAYPVRIEIGDKTDGGWELVSGLDEGSEVVLDPSPLIREGDPLNVR